MGIDNDSIVEQRIRAAFEAGEFDDLPGRGAPLPADDASMVPAELRVAWRLLKNAGFVPPEVAHMKSIAALEAEAARAADAGDGAARARALKKLQLLRTELGSRRLSAGELDYREKLLGKLG